MDHGVSPYRDGVVAIQSKGIAWRRWLVESLACLRDRKVFRQWAGGRWAHFAWIYNTVGHLGLRDVCSLADLAAEESGEGYGGFEQSFACLDDRWRAVRACPHMRRAELYLAAPGCAEIRHVVVPCECEVWGGQV